MQTANCHVRLGGDINNEVFKPGVTVAEIVVLRAVHGSDSVVKVQPTGNDKRAHAGELDRLKLTYGEKFIEATFPGAYPQLPVNFKDIGIDMTALLDAPKAKKTKGDAGVTADATTDAGDNGAQE